jgi:hypothetical protein
MTRSLYAVPAMLCLAAALVTAQAPAADRPAQAPDKPAAQQPTTPKPTTPPAASSSAANKVTYTGCVKPGTGTDSWILENAEASAKPGASSTVGTSGTSKMTLNLDPAASVDLKPHANHKVEVTGSISPAKPAAGGAPAAGATARQDFSVESVKMVSATCP